MELSIMVFAVCCTLVGCIRYDFTGWGLTSVPWHFVGGLCTDLRVENNKLVTLTYIPNNLPLLTQIDLDINRLEAFPDLENVKTTIIEIDLGYNRITEIHPTTLLSKLVALKQLDISYNPLVLLPDVLVFPPKLFELEIAGTDLTFLPNMCLLDNNQRQFSVLMIDHLGNAYHCGSQMMWTKLAYDQGLLDPAFKPSCGSPVGVSWASYDVNSIKTQQPFYQKLTDPTNFFCVPHITSVTSHVSVLRCAAWCHAKPLCLMFAVDSGQCVLTEFVVGSPGSRAAFLAYSDWRILK